MYDDLDKRVADEAVEATEGLRKTQAELAGERNRTKADADALQARFYEFGGEDGIEKLLAFRERFASDEISKLLEAEQHERYFRQRTEPIRWDYERQPEAANSRVKELDSDREAIKLRRRVVAGKDSATMNMPKYRLWRESHAQG
ncbi:MAG: hypothetical protein ACR2QF_09135 [Geminicoccaceae bacterium]